MHTIDKYNAFMQFYVHPIVWTELNVDIIDINDSFLLMSKLYSSLSTLALSLTCDDFPFLLLVLWFNTVSEPEGEPSINRDGSAGGM